MVSEVLKTAYSQYNRWKNELERTAAFTNMKDWEAVILAHGGKLPTGITGEKKAPAAKGAPASQDTKKAKVRVICAAYIREAPSHFVTRQELQSHLASKGIIIELKRLSAILSETPEFVADRQKGWSLKEFAAA